MEFLIEKIILRIAKKNPAHAAKLTENLLAFKKECYPYAEAFLNKYNVYLEKNGQSIDYAVDCYLRMYNDMLEERWKFKKSGTYSNTSFKEVEKNIYHNEDIMTYHMNGLVLGQFLWFDQYLRFDFFKKNLHRYTEATINYLEIGGGHGLYMLEALQQFSPLCKFDLIDISPSSIALAKGIIQSPKVNYRLENILEIEGEAVVDFFTMGEVLEHLEDPQFMLNKLHKLLTKNGKGFISTPINSAMIDHIYLFNHPDEIRSLLKRAGFTILEEKMIISEQMDYALALKLKVPIMYAAFIEKQHKHAPCKQSG